MARTDNITIENAKIVLRNFSGAADSFNPTPGNRTFCVLLDYDTARAMEEDGWNVSQFRKREDDDPNDPPQDFLKVKVSYKVRKPVIVVITKNTAGKLVRRNYGEDLVDLLDAVDITNCDLMISPYKWDVNGKSGIKAYLDSMYVSINTNALEQKYADVEFAE